VIVGSPAEKAGVKKYDIVLELADKPIDSPEALTKLIQAGQDKPTTMRLLRAAKSVIIPITAAIRKVEVNPPQEALRFLTGSLRVNEPAYHGTVRTLVTLAEEQQAARLKTSRVNIDDVCLRLDVLEKDVKALQRIEALEKELKAMRDALQKLSEDLKPTKT